MMAQRLIGANGYTPVVAAAYNVANNAGTSPVSVSVSFVDGYNVGQLPGGGAYTVHVTPSQACAVSVSNKSTTGFTVTLTALSGSISVGTFDVLVHS